MRKITGSNKQIPSFPFNKFFERNYHTLDVTDGIIKKCDVMQMQYFPRESLLSKAHLSEGNFFLSLHKLVKGNMPAELFL